jgi:hypothetical protein
VSATDETTQRGYQDVYEPDPNYVDPNNIPVTVSDLIADSRELRVHSVVDPTKYFTLYYRPGNYTLDMYKAAARLVETNTLDLHMGVYHLQQLVDSWDLQEWVDREEHEIDHALPEVTPMQARLKYKKLQTVPVTEAGLGRQGIEAVGHILMRIMLDIRGRREEAQLGKGSPTPSEGDVDATNVVPMGAFTSQNQTTPTPTPATTPTGQGRPARSARRAGTGSGSRSTSTSRSRVSSG